jgi:hypothetical protein
MQPYGQPYRRPSQTPFYMPLLLSIIAGGLLMAAAFFAQQTLSYQQEAQRVTGMVVRMQQDSRSGAKPVVGYLVDDRHYEVVAGVSQSPPAYHIGEEVELMYLPDNPGDARIDSFMENWFMTLMLGGFGALTLFGSLFAWLTWLKRSG